MSEWIKWEGGECPVPPNTLVEYRLRCGGSSTYYAGSIAWDCWDTGLDIVAYRVAEEPPRTITVNGVVVPEPMREAPKQGTYFFTVGFTADIEVGGFHWYGLRWQERALKRGLCHLTEAAAITHFEALIKPSRRN